MFRPQIFGAEIHVAGKIEDVGSLVELYARVGGIVQETIACAGNGACGGLPFMHIRSGRRRSCHDVGAILRGHKRQFAGRDSLFLKVGHLYHVRPVGFGSCAGYGQEVGIGPIVG